MASYLVVNGYFIGQREIEKYVKMERGKQSPDLIKFHVKNANYN